MSDTEDRATREADDKAYRAVVTAIRKFFTERGRDDIRLLYDAGLTFVILDAIRDLGWQPAPASEGSGSYDKIMDALNEVDDLLEEYGIDTVGTGPAPPKKEQARVDAILERSRKRRESRLPDIKG